MLKFEISYAAVSEELSGQFVIFQKLKMPAFPHVLPSFKVTVKEIMSKKMINALFAVPKWAIATCPVSPHHSRGNRLRTENSSSMVVYTPFRVTLNIIFVFTRNKNKTRPKKIFCFIMFSYLALQSSE